MKFIPKTLFTLLTVAWAMSFSFSARASVALNVYTSQDDYPIYTIILEEKPVVTFSNSGLHIKAMNENNVVTAEIDLPFDDMPRFEFTDAEQTLDIEEYDDEMPVPFCFEYTDGQTVFINGLSEPEYVSVYGIDGRRRPADIERHTRSVAVHLDQLPKGYYIIRTEKHSFKIYRK